MVGEQPAAPPRIGAPRTGVVLIGRNEGARLVAALAAIPETVERVVYVDSGSTDGSVAAARAAGAEVVELDLSTPFTAARARNEGFARLREIAPVELVQFIDGDCALQPGWLRTATAFLAETPGCAVVCGRRRERFPQASVYNRLCDLEWDTPVGEARACGGDALMRAEVFEAMGGYDPAVIAGEEPELCQRLRRAGWTIWRIDAEMTLHDADMHRLGQWWTRARRYGHAAAEGMAMHGAGPDRHGVAGTVRALTWGLALPLAILVLAFAWPLGALVLVLIYPAQVLRLARRYAGNGERDFALRRAALSVLGKLPEAQGALQYGLRRLRGRQGRIIEYK